MKRRIIGQGNNSHTLTLPIKWIRENNLNEGVEVDITHEGPDLLISAQNVIKPNKISIDLSNLDRTSIVYTLRIAYKMGFDEILLKFNNKTVPHLRKKIKKSVLSVIHEEANLLIGMEIIKEHEFHCVLKDISQGSYKDFDDIVKTILNLLVSANRELIDAIKKQDLIEVGTIEEKHNSITKFISYCLRIINKTGTKKNKNLILWYHLIANLDEFIDIIKYCGRDYLNNNIKLNKETIEILESTHDCLELFQRFFFFCKNEYQTKIYKKRDKIIRKIRSIKKYSIDEIILVNSWINLLEVIVDSMETRRGLSLTK